MSNNPDLLFVLNGTSGTKASKPATGHKIYKDPRHSCINGTKISTCKNCAGHILRGKRYCVICRGMGFTTSKCMTCVRDAVVALQELVQMKAEDEMEEAEKEPKMIEVEDKVEMDKSEEEVEDAEME